MDSNVADKKRGTSATPEAPCPRVTWLVSALLVFCFLCAFFHVSDVDVGYHIRTGEHIMAGHGIPAVNTFSYTVPNEPWLAQQWLPATLYAWIHRLGGVPALSTFKALIATVLMFLIWCSARQATHKNSLWPFWVVTAAVLILRVRFYERPDLFTSTLFALVVLLDQRFGRNLRWQWIFLPLLMALWANIHAGYVYGVVLLGALAASEFVEILFRKLRRSTDDVETVLPVRELWIRPASVALCVIGAIGSIQLINPNGWRVLTVPFTQFLSPFWQSVILEYFPPTWANSKLLFIWAGIIVALQLLTWRQARARYLLTTLVFGYFAFSSQRSLPAFIIASAPHLAFMLSHVAQWKLAPVSRFSRPLLPVTWAAVIAMVIVPDRTFQFGLGRYHAYYPTEIFRFMAKEVPPQNLFNDMRLGGPMLWELYPTFKPFIDGRGDAYSEAFWQSDYLPAVKGDKRWREIFEKHRVTGALLANPSATQVSGLAKILFGEPDWALVAYNDETLLFLKRTDANQPLIERHSFTHLWPGNWNFGAINATNLPVMALEATRAYEMHPGIYAQAASARCAMVAGDYRGASELLDFVVKESDASAAFWSDYAFCLYASQNHVRAERVLTDMIHQGRSVGFAYYLKHSIALDLQKPGEAKEFLVKAIASEPGNQTYQKALRRFQSGAASAGAPSS